MLKKPLVLAFIATTLTAGTLPTDATASGDPLLGALVGAGIGAAIGHGVNGRDGAWVGGALGAITGASIAASSGGYYDQGYYGVPAAYPPAPAYYGAPSVTYAPAPTYYGAPAVIYRPAPVHYAHPAAVYRPRAVPVGHYPGFVQPYPRHYPAIGRTYEHSWQDPPNLGGYRGPEGNRRGGG